MSQSTLKRFLVITLSVMTCWTILFAQSLQPVAPENLAAKFDEYFSALTSLDKFNGCVLVAEDQEVLFHKAYNAADSVAGFHADLDRQFIIASISKLFTKIAIFKLEEQGRLSTQDYIGKHIADFTLGEKITIQHLLDNTSGLPRTSGAPNFEEIPLEAVMDSIRTLDLIDEPGAKKHYSNAGYSVLAYIIQQVSGQSFEHYLKNALLIPFGLTHTGMYHVDSDIPGLAKGYMLEDGTLSNVDELVVNSYGAGGLYSTTRDLMTFSCRLSDPAYVSAAIAAKMKGDNDYIRWTGGNIGYNSYFKKSFTTHLTVIILSNFHITPMNKVVEDINALMDSKPYELPTLINNIAVPVAPEILKLYVGQYQLEVDKNIKFDIQFTEGRLILTQLGTENRDELFPKSDTQFF
ncbi:serine hydrolase, partial [bacterium]|nr:serine hydrolase [bacterium]